MELAGGMNISEMGEHWLVSERECVNWEESIEHGGARLGEPSPGVEMCIWLVKVASPTADITGNCEQSLVGAVNPTWFLCKICLHWLLCLVPVYPHCQYLLWKPFHTLQWQNYLPSSDACKGNRFPSPTPLSLIFSSYSLFLNNRERLHQLTPHPFSTVGLWPWNWTTMRWW